MQEAEESKLPTKKEKITPNYGDVGGCFIMIA